MNKRIIRGFLGAALALVAPYAHAQFGSEPAKIELINEFR